MKLNSQLILMALLLCTSKSFSQISNDQLQSEAHPIPEYSYGQLGVIGTDPRTMFLTKPYTLSSETSNYAVLHLSVTVDPKKRLYRNVNTGIKLELTSSVREDRQPKRCLFYKRSRNRYLNLTDANIYLLQDVNKNTGELNILSAEIERRIDASGNESLADSEAREAKHTQIKNFCEGKSNDISALRKNVPELKVQFTVKY